MTPPLSPAAATQLVLWGGLVVGVALGVVAQATRCCTMGALADGSRLALWLSPDEWLVIAEPGSAGAIETDARAGPRRRGVRQVRREFGLSHSRDRG